MVLTSEQYQQAKTVIKSNRKVASLLKLRDTTTNFIIQCLADREIQSISEDKQSRAYSFNCGVVHDPSKYVDVNKFITLKLYIIALYCLLNHQVIAMKCCSGWNSSASKPCRLSRKSNSHGNISATGPQSCETISQLEKLLADKQQVIDNLEDKWQDYYDTSMEQLQASNSQLRQQDLDSIYNLMCENDKLRKQQHGGFFSDFDILVISLFLLYKFFKSTPFLSIVFYFIKRFSILLRFAS